MGGHFWWWCAFCAAPPAPRRSGGRHSRGALRPLRRPLSPPAAAFNSPSGAGWTPARSAFPARTAQGHSPWASCCGNHLKAGACAGDGLTQQLKGSHSPHHHRARAAAGVPAALRQHVAAAASPVSVIGLPSSDELGDRCGRRGDADSAAPDLLSDPARSAAQGSRLCRRVRAWRLPDAGPNSPALARATAPGAGWDISS